MGVLMFIVLVTYMLWILKGRELYVMFKHKKETGIPVPADLTREALMGKIKSDLDYPTLKESYYDENGQIILKCKHGAHALTIADKLLYVGRTNAKITSKKSYYIEETECIKAYIWKLFDPDAPINPQAMYKKLKNHKRNTFLITLLILTLFMSSFMMAADEAGVMDGFDSKNISTSYLSEYSEEVTIGEAFNDFFGDPEWVGYEEGAQKLVDFKGTCTYDGESATMIITFIHNGDSFFVDKIKVNGQEMLPIMHDSIFKAIYENK